MKLTEKEVLQLMEYAGAGPNDLVPRGYAATVEIFSHVANAAYTLGIDRANAAQPTLRDQVDRANAAEAISASLLEINRDLLMRNFVSHELFQTGDPGCPEQALDRNGEVVLGVCKNCGRVEAELDEHCDHCTLIKNLRAEIASLTSPKG